jgi:hypothetical protein
MTAQVRQHATGGDGVPVGPLDFDDDEHLLITVHLDGQVDAPAPDEPPLAFWVSRCPREPGQEG